MMQTVNKPPKEELSCYHCGDDCLIDTIVVEDKPFCCNGCKAVFEILSSNALGDYYDLENRPGINMKSKSSERFDYLDNEEVIEKLLDFQDENISKVQFYIPQIHCSACIWLLENLYQLNSEVRSSRVNFLKKEVYITYDHKELGLRQLVEVLASLGYEPKITLEQLEEEKRKPISRRLIYQVGLAGFAFGNIMLMSLPEYFGLDADSYRDFAPWFGWINLALATPVALYSGQDYFKSALKSIQQRRLNIDVPIALGVLVLYIRSAFEILSSTGAGYFDSLCGLLFFLLLGRIFQEKVYHQLSFERDYRSYFPIAVSRLNNGKEESIPIKGIQKGDKILIRNGELIPVDAFLIKGKARIDNSFATGESEPNHVEVGNKIFAGGRQIGEAIQLEVIRPLNQSKLTRLWSEYAAKEKSSATFSGMTDKISQYFTPAILLIGFLAGFYHLQFRLGEAIEVFSAVLIVACPCALALAAPFTFGHATRFLGKQDCYLKEANVIEEMAKINQIVFDKTGTLTYGNQQQVSYTGEVLSEKEQQVVLSLVNQSNHPVSRMIKAYLEQAGTSARLLSEVEVPLSDRVEIKGFQEYEGKGIEGEIGKVKYRLGSAAWLECNLLSEEGTNAMLEVNGEIKGCFSVQNEYRKGLRELLSQLANHFTLSLLSGDNDSHAENLKNYFPSKSIILFDQQPKQKLSVIKALRRERKKVMMIGDGLNDAGALRESNVGVAISENVNTFSPACDVILAADQFSRLNQILQFSRQCRTIVIVSFVISLLYNVLGLSFAVQGLLSPVFAAILMPISSITVVGFVSLAVWVVSGSLKRTSWLGR